MGFLLVAGLVAVVTTTALPEGLHNSVCRQRGEGEVRWERGEGVMGSDRREEREKKGEKYTRSVLISFHHTNMSHAETVGIKPININTFT